MAGTDCLPWWHTLLDGIPNTTIASGAATNNGQLQADPEALRAAAEAQLQAYPAWTAGGLSIDVYSLARYLQSEVGTAKIEQSVAVAEAAINQAAHRGISTTQLLTLSSCGGYGAIQPSGTGNPYGRWASTSQDPTLHALLIADFVANGKSGNFAQGAYDQDGLESRASFPDPNVKIDFEAQHGNYWVGPLPGVDHWVTTLWAHTGDDPASLAGQALVARAKAQFADRTRPDWSSLPVCDGLLDGPGLSLTEILLLGATVAGALALGHRLGRRGTHPV